MVNGVNTQAAHWFSSLRREEDWATAQPVHTLTERHEWGNDGAGERGTALRQESLYNRGDGDEDTGFGTAHGTGGKADDCRTLVAGEWGDSLQSPSCPLGEISSEAIS